MSEQQRAKEISDRKWEEITSRPVFRHAVEAHQHQRVSEKDGVVKKSLGRHQNEAEKRTLSMLMQDRVPNLPPRRVRSRVDPRGWRIMRRQHSRIRHNLALDFVDDRFRLRISSVDHQPTRTFPDPPTKENHDQAQRRTDPEGKAPA